VTATFSEDAVVQDEGKRRQGIALNGEKITRLEIY
jgi:hypothetical protein